MRTVSRYMFVLCLVSGFWAAESRATLYSVTNITTDNASNIIIGKAQFYVQVEDAGAGEVRFIIGNSGARTSSIEEVYFDNGVTPLQLAGLTAIENSAGVEFTSPATPSELPGANNATPEFHTTYNLSATAKPPKSKQGINEGESLGIVFNLVSGKSYSDVINALGDGSLRVGLHAQSFDLSGSDSFILIPSPATLSLLMAGLATYVGFKRRS